MNRTISLHIKYLISSLEENPVWISNFQSSKLISEHSGSSSKECKGAKYGCDRASSTVILSSGSNRKSFSSRSTAVEKYWGKEINHLTLPKGLLSGNNSIKSVFATLGRLLYMSIDFSFNSDSFISGFPVRLTIKEIWWTAKMDSI